MSTTMEDQKATIYDKLKEITTLTVDGHTKTVKVYQERPEEIVLEDYLAVTFLSDNDVPAYDLSNEIVKQDTELKVDLWGLTSLDTSALIAVVESKLRELKYKLVYNQDISDPKGYAHKTTRFNF